MTTAVLNTEITEVEDKILNSDKCSTTPEFNKLTAENFTAILKQPYLVSKTYFDCKLTRCNRNLLQVKQNI